MTASNIVLTALREAVKAITKHNLEYCIFGGLALQAYKRIRATMDVDIMLAIDETEINSFRTYLTRKGFEINKKNGIAEIHGFKFIRSVYSVISSGIDVYVDFLIVKGDFQKEVLRRKRHVDIFGLRVNIASCEDLILLKILSNRPLDRIDAETLVRENKDIDRYYIKRWAKILGIERRIRYLLRGN